MRIATRLVLLLGTATAAVMAVYALITQQQREALLGDALIRETETLARTLQIVTSNALRDRRFGDLNQVLESVVEDPETFMITVSDRQGNRLAGAVESHLACVPRGLPPLAGPASPLRGWAECDGRIRWVVLPLRAPASTLLLARRATVVEREIAASRRRHLLLTVALVTTAALTILVLLRKILSRPLAEIMRGVQSLGQGGPTVPVKVPGSAGELGALASAFNAMTEQLEEQRQRILREAEEHVALERRLREAEKFAVVGRLSGGLAHELGSPLNVIGMRAETIAASAAASPFLRREAEEIVREVERIAGLVRGLLHVARRHGIEPAPVDVADVVRRTAVDIQGASKAAGVKLEIHSPDSPLLIRGDATLLRHALFNLLLNAVHALADHGGDRRLSLRVEQDVGKVRVVVEDTGPGICPEHLAHVFEPFFTTKEIGQGTGLGLSVSRGIVEEHGGQLRLEPGENGGVRATMILPVNGPSRNLEVA
jgi:signal transduction histidine kinase